MDEYKKYTWCNHMVTGGKCANPKYNNYCLLGGCKDCKDIKDCKNKEAK